MSRLIVVALCLGVLAPIAEAQDLVVSSEARTEAADHQVIFAPGSDLPPFPLAEEDPWFGADKLLHVSASFLITLSSQYVLVHRMNLPHEQAWPVSAGTSLSFGLFKELADSQRPVRPLFSWRDMAWNAAGVALAMGVILL